MPFGYPSSRLLGRSYSKLAAEGGINAEHTKPVDNQGFGVTKNQERGITSPQQLIQWITQNVAGEEAAALINAVTMIGSAVSSDARTYLSRPIQFGYGGNIDAVLNQSEQLKGAMARQQAAFSNAIPAAIRDGLAKVGVPPFIAEGINTIINQVPEGVRGRLYQDLSMAFPSFRDIISIASPNTLMDMTPFINATRLANSGQFNGQYFDALVTGFEQQVAQGAFGDVPADIAAGAIDEAIRRGSKDPLNDAVRINATADLLVKEGLISSYRDAASLAPDMTEADVREYSALAQQGAIDRNVFNSAIQLAKEQSQRLGRPVRPSEVMTAIGLGAVAQRGGMTATGDRRNAESIQQAAVEMYSDVGGSRSFRMLEALHAVADNRTKAAIEQAIESGDQQRLVSLMAQARKDPEANRQFYLMDPSSPSRFNVNPLTAQAVAMHDMRLATEMYNAPDMRAILSDVPRMQQILATGDMRGIDYRTRALLATPRVRALMAGQIASSQRGQLAAAPQAPKQAPAAPAQARAAPMQPAATPAPVSTPVSTPEPAPAVAATSTQGPGGAAAVTAQPKTQPQVVA